MEREGSKYHHTLRIVFVKKEITHTLMLLHQGLCFNINFGEKLNIEAIADVNLLYIFKITIKKKNIYILLY